ncbi:MAG: radical SAM protein [Chloroflexi bacterium]|nr:radical SAM protein [Chloroflexota bacterium]
MKRVLLIAPPFYRLMGSHYNGLHLGIGYIAAVLKQNGYEVKLYNADYLNTSQYADQRQLFNNFSTYKATLTDLTHPIWQEIGAKIASFAPDLIGITMKTANYAAARNIASIAKSMDSNIKTVVGGTHPTLDPAGTLAVEYFDYVVRGEGEFTLLELVGGQKEKQIKGLSFKRKGSPVHNEDRPFIQDLDSLPFPARDLFLNGTEGIEFGSIITGRGCPFQCAYCASPRLWHRLTRYRSVANVLAELEELKTKYNSSLIHFADDTFTLDKKRTKEICQQIIDRRLGIEWVCDTRVDRLDEELVVLMKQAGCIRIKIGVESGSDRILNEMHKGITTQMVRHAVRLIKKHGVPITAYFMVGFPNETNEDLRQTIDFAKELNIDYYSLSVIAPYYGTEVWSEMEKSGRKLDKEHWEYFYHQSQEMILNNDLDPKLLDEFFALNEWGKGGRV